MLREIPADGASIPGVTTIDPVTPAQRAIARPNRLVRFIAGDLDPLPPPSPTIPLRSTGDTAPGGVESVLEGAGPASIAPPSDAVRREMARLELEALKAALESQAGQVVPDARGVSGGDATQAIEAAEADRDAEGEPPA